MIEINNQELKNYAKPFIVAEAGINHNGELTKALEMIEVAKQSGVDAVKFQTFRAEEFCGDKTQMFTYQSQGQKITESMFEMFKRYEFVKSSEPTLMADNSSFNNRSKSERFCGVDRNKIFSSSHFCLFFQLLAV